MEDFFNKLHTVNSISITVAIVTIIFIVSMPLVAIVLLGIFLPTYLSYKTMIDENLPVLNKLLYMFVLWCIPVIGALVVGLVMRREHMKSISPLINNEGTMTSEIPEKLLES